jgi:hypothetical protein
MIEKLLFNQWTFTVVLLVGMVLTAYLGMKLRPDETECWHGMRINSTDLCETLTKEEDSVMFGEMIDDGTQFKKSH